jgi:argininosuccinate lyase
MTKGRAGNGSGDGKAWSGRFREPTHRLVEAFTGSVTVDRRLYAQDIQGSIAHCKTLGRARVLTQGETRTIVKALEAVKAELDRGRFKFVPQDEDIHMAIERRLTELIGPLGGKLHTGRSRNDQVALDVRMYLRQKLDEFAARLKECQRVLVAKAKAHRSVAMPGYTHLQRAQPVLLAHHLLAYVDMLERDKGRIQDAQKRLNVMPLGSGALAGTNYPVDRRYTAELLGFPQVTTNSLDAVSDRDFMIEIAAALAITMMHLSRLSEELIVWSSQEFGFVDLPDGFCTGSSMMPQKKNPDVPELIRGRTGRVYGQLINLLTTMKALPTEMADYLVGKGMPFREAHGVTGRVVRSALERRRELTSFTLEELRQFSDRFDKGVFARLTVQAAIDRKAQIGGTARGQVEQRIRQLERMLS